MTYCYGLASVVVQRASSTNIVVMMTKEGSTKIVNFMTPGAGVLVLGRGHISHLMKMHYFFKKSSSLLPGIDQSN